MFFKLNQATATAGLFAIALPHITVASDIIIPHPVPVHSHFHYKLRAHKGTDQTGYYQDFSHPFEGG
ncbi:hypothetical protein BV22DRAFT_1031093 [Leucogyrophana mollusca]|uniref:Uncharacterized protein n=1 Tax=Leucogyrophana mollusca TaxID=85980 RepID=A0ACB8BR41_9AGAM|nr:hypothetical protein BV22DRAFT_1031093 [Leucogyrophana mollusca]